MLWVRRLELETLVFQMEYPRLTGGRGGGRGAHAAGSTKSVRMLWWHHLKIDLTWLKADLLVGAAGPLGWDPTGAWGQLVEPEWVA